MGTMLFTAGLDSGNAPETWNADHPEQIQAVHQAYITAGSQIILTNTFGGNHFRLRLHGLEGQAVELNQRGAEIGRAAAAHAPHPVLVAGSMGPTGELLTPMGHMHFEEAQAAFAEQAQGLAAGGADLLWIETMSDLEEVRAAVQGARSVTDLPICATMSFDTSGRTMMGVTATQAAQTMGEWGLLAVGANCGNNLADTEAVIAEMHRAAPDLLLIAKANAGLPRWQGTALVYDGTPEVMAAFAHRVQQQGARLIGACCGSTPEHIRLMGAVLRGEMEPPAVSTTTQPTTPTIPRPARERRQRRQRPTSRR